VQTNLSHVMAVSIQKAVYHECATVEKEHFLVKFCCLLANDQGY
jgi:hypothetical protein